MRYIVYVLTIKRNKHRYDNLCAYLDEHHIDYEIIYGADSKYLSDGVVKNFKSNALLPKSTTCCGITHMMAWKRLIDSKHDYAIMLEDDTYIDVVKFKRAKASIEDSIRRNKFVYLYYDVNIPFKDNNFTLSFGAYAINKHVANRIFNYFMVNKLKFHIDVEINKVLRTLQLNNIVHRCCYQIDGNKSTMKVKHDTYYITTLRDTYVFRGLTTPVCMINGIEIDGYSLIIFTINIVVIVYFNNGLALAWSVYFLYLLMELTHP